MPELPEVETIKRDLETNILDLSFLGVKVRDARVLYDITPARFQKQLTGRTIRRISRRGKGLIFHLDQGYLFVQVKMTGFFVIGSKSDAKETKIIFRLSNGQYLNYNDQRLFGWFFLVKNLVQIPYLHTIGPEPLDDAFNPDWLKDHLEKRTSPIKPLLMNQHFVAGIGNIYASEILFKAGIHPKKKANRLTRKQIDLLHRSTVAVLKESIAFRGTSMRNYRDSKGEKGNFLEHIRVYGKTKEPCPACQSEIKRIVQAGRSTFYCTQCQK